MESQRSFRLQIYRYIALIFFVLLAFATVRSPR
nr:MAG TPA: hypothetical protein [Caudoviricetes sp.]